MGGWNIFYALINFAILAAALYFVGKKVVVKMLNDNRQKISDQLDKAEKARAEAQNINAELDNIAAQGNAECGEIIQNSQTVVQTNSEAAGEKGKAIQSEEERRERRDAETLTRQRLSELKDEAASELLAEAATQLSSDKYAADRERLETGFASKVEGLLKFTAADKAKLLWGEKVPVRLSGVDERALKNKEQVLLSAEKALGKDNICFDCEIDPGLIGGLKLTVGDTVYDGTLAYMLSRLRGNIAAERNIDGEIGVYFSKAFSSADTSIESFQMGTLLSYAEGVCRISGLSDVMAGEMVMLEGGQRAMVMDIEKNQVSAVLLDNGDNVHSGGRVRRTGRVTEVPVGEALIGRVVDGLGKPIDGLGAIDDSEMRPVENIAPSIRSRRPVSMPLQTGILAIDALVPIGRGQRELIIGDRQTGKTSIAIDTLVNQKGKDVVCIYVAIGQKESTVASIVEKLREQGAMDYTVIVDANASDPAPMLYLAPYTGAAIGEYLMNKGRHVLVIYDDLSKHAVAYRELSLLLHRPPGREAYPGDVFYLHSRLLERAACLSEEMGGGSMTALPIVETQAGDISAYIPTNVISITDGQIFLDEGMFNSGNRPAINAGLSVSRVGGAAQPKAMKQFASRLRMDMAQHRELEAFAQFGSDLDKATREALNRGRKITELMVQKRFSPQTTAAQVAAVFAANEGFLDELAAGTVAQFRDMLSVYLYKEEPELCRHIDEGGKLDDGQKDTLRKAIEKFKAGFAAEN